MWISLLHTSIQLAQTHENSGYEFWQPLKNTLSSFERVVAWNQTRYQDIMSSLHQLFGIDIESLVTQNDSIETKDDLILHFGVQLPRILTTSVCSLVKILQLALNAGQLCGKLDIDPNTVIWSKMDIFVDTNMDFEIPEPLIRNFFETLCHQKYNFKLM